MGQFDFILIRDNEFNELNVKIIYNRIKAVAASSIIAEAMSEKIHLPPFSYPS